MNLRSGSRSFLLLQLVVGTKSTVLENNKNAIPIEHKIPQNKGDTQSSHFFITKDFLLSFLLNIMDRIFTSCTTLNNHGVKQIRDGQYYDAASSLKESLYLAKNILSLLDSQENGDCCEMKIDQNQAKGLTYTAISQVHSSSYECSVVMPLPTNGEKTSNNDTIEKVSSEREAHQFIYKNPLELSSSVPSVLDHEVAIEISVAIMFNLALSHHFHALRGNSQDRESVLGQAIGLYELAYTVQVQEDIELSAECTMAIINNMGQIHGLLGNHEKQTKCFQQLLSTILLLQSYGEATCETEGFVRSVSHLILKKIVAPSA
jgi:hypothetical protein